MLRRITLLIPIAVAFLRPAPLRATAPHRSTAADADDGWEVTLSGAAPRGESTEARQRRSTWPMDARARRARDERASRHEKEIRAPNSSIGRAAGLKYKDDVVGEGDAPEKGDVVSLEYTGWLAASDFMFDTSRAAASASKTHVGAAAPPRPWPSRGRDACPAAARAQPRRRRERRDAPPQVRAREAVFV